MKKTTTLLLGTAAAMFVATGVEAADPIFDVVDPREPVYRCDITGFIELPGTDICFKVGGFARFSSRVSSGDWAGGRYHQTAWGIRPSPDVVDHDILFATDPDTGLPIAAAVTGIEFGPPRDRFAMGATGRINFDARTATEYGTVRAFVELQGINPVAQGGSTGSDPVIMRHAFVQFGNWTFGQTWSNFPGPGLAPRAFSHLNLHDNTHRIPQVAYTQPFGNGFSATIAVEDQSGRTAAIKEFSPFWLGEVSWPLALGQPVERSGYAPAVVGNIAASGAWGSAQLGGVLMFQRTRIQQTFGDPLDDDVLITQWVGAGNKTGWGVDFGMALNVPTTEGSQFLFKTTYTDGASQYNAGTNQSLIWGGFPDEDFDVFGIRDTVTIWTIGAAYRHIFSPTTAFTFGGAYGEIDFGASSGIFGVVGFDDFDTSVAFGNVKRTAWEVFANIEWTPVANTTFMLEGMWGRLDTGVDFAVEGVDNRLYQFGGKNDAWSIGFDVVRSF